MPIRLTFAAALMLLAAAAGAEEKQVQWSEYQSPARGFAVSFPGSPETNTASVAGLNPLTRYSFRANQGDDIVYSVVVLEYPAGKGPKPPSDDLFAGMVAAYAKDSESRIRKKGSKTIANRDGYEAIADDKSGGKLSHLIDIVPDGDRLYMVISAGPKGHAGGDEAEQFRDSFRLLSDPEETGSTHATTTP
jgi:hypothetical protein